MFLGCGSEDADPSVPMDVGIENDVIRALDADLNRGIHSLEKSITMQA